MFLTGLERMKAVRSKVMGDSDAFNLRHSKRADHYANRAVSHMKNINGYNLKMNEAAEKAITVRIEEIVLRAVVEEFKQLDNNQNPKKFQALEANLQKKVEKAIEDTEFDEEKYRNFADWYWQYLHDDIEEDEILYRKVAAISKSSASEALRLYKLYELEVKQAKQVKRSFQAEYDAQNKKVNHLVQGLMAALDGERPQLNSNFGAILPAKSTYATQDPIAAHAAPIMHLDTDSHVIPAPEELDLTSSLLNPPKVEMKLERKRQSDHLDDNRESGV
ncbi:hypothetical protein Plhal304r1_c008g0031841 [Plasmopara halstedii]